jgi:hypothetical protein
MVAMRYGGGARLDIGALLLRGITAPERRTGLNRSAQAKAPHRSGGNLTSGALDDAGPHAAEGVSRGMTTGSGCLDPLGDLRLGEERQRTAHVH